MYPVSAAWPMSNAPAAAAWAVSASDGWAMPPGPGFPASLRAEQVVLAGEPTGNPRSGHRESILALLRELHEAGRTIVVIIHDQHIGAAMPRRVEMRDGMIGASPIPRSPAWARPMPPCWSPSSVAPSARPADQLARTDQMRSDCLSLASDVTGDNTAARSTTSAVPTTAEQRATASATDRAASAAMTSTTIPATLQDSVTYSRANLGAARLPGPDHLPQTRQKSATPLPRASWQRNLLSPPRRCQEAPEFMPADQAASTDPARLRLLTTALWLVSISVAFGVLSGAVSMTTGLHDHSLGVFAIGLGVLADVTGSAVLIWRFGAERRQPMRSGTAEARAAIAVAVALAVVSAVLIVGSVAALAAGSRPGTSRVTLVAASASLAVLTPLAYAKRRVGRLMASRALQGDGTLSGIGAATSLLALTALVLYHTLGWWWADRITALLVAAIAAAEAWHTAPHRHPRP
jgi:energy-coupling factor transporter ATP-binding protein EcfA2